MDNQAKTQGIKDAGKKANNSSKDKNTANKRVNNSGMVKFWLHVIPIYDSIYNLIHDFI